MDDGTRRALDELRRYFDDEPAELRTDLGEHDRTLMDLLRGRPHWAKNAPHESGRSWAPGDDLSDVAIAGTLSLDTEADWFRCPYGHEHYVIRRGTETAARFS